MQILKMYLTFFLAAKLTEIFKETLSMSKMTICGSRNWSERHCAGGALQQGYAVTSKFIGIFSSLSLHLITQHVVVVVNLPSQAGTECGQMYTNVYRKSHQTWPVKGLGLRVYNRK